MIHAIIQARMLSSRLRGKSLMSVGGKPLLARVIERVRAIESIDQVTVATTTDMADDPIDAMARHLGVGICRGDRQDVLDRFRQAAEFNADDDCILRYTADNPIYDPGVTQLALKKHLESDFEYTHIDGLSHMVPEFLSVGALRRAAELASEDYDREHVTPFIRKHTDRFRCQTLAADFAGLRPELDPHLTIDNQEQLEVFESMLYALEPKMETVDIQACYRWLDFRRAGLESAANAVVKQSDDRSGQESGFHIAGRSIGRRSPCFIVAEIGQNHNGQMGMAKRLIDVAADSGCDAVKFQKRDIRWELTEEAYNRPYENPNSFGKTYGQHREFLELDEDQHIELREYAIARGVIYFCTACDPPSVDLMQRVGNPVFKIASRDITNIPLLRKVSETNKPAIISTGMAGLEEIQEAIEAIGGTRRNLLITHCVSQYPTEIKHVNLRAMETIEKQFGCLVGLSDHTTGIITCVAAVAMGAPFIEKHITLSRAMPGTDHAAALEEEGLRRMVRYIRTVELAMGDGEKAFLPEVESAKVKLARSLTSAVQIPRGTVLEETHLIMKSPGDGIPWNRREMVVGKRARVDIPPDSTLRTEDFQ
nr:N-acetylneuraminate synthase family protein [Rhodopirellula sp. SM50]